MKKRSLLLLFAASVFVAAGLHGNPFCVSPWTADSRVVLASPAPQPAVSDAAHIARIENGLLHAVTIKGQPSQPMKLADRMLYFKVPGVSMAFFEHGKIAWTRVYGFADVAVKQLVAPDTLFQAGSISKPIAALAALRLVEQGRLSLDEDVNLKLKIWKVPENEFTKKQKVTLRRLLSHSAGMTVHGFPGYASDETAPIIVQVLNGEKPANTAPIRVDVTPGTTWRYSGGGFTVMQLLLGDVTGKPFPQLLEETVLVPAGMKHATYEQPLPKDRTANAATPYRGSGEPVEGGSHTYPEMAAAGLWATPSDLAMAAIEVENSLAGKSNKILSQSMTRQMLSKQKGDWGLGFSLESESGAARFSHAGADEGFISMLVDFPELHQGVAIMTNADNGGDLIREILRAVGKEYGWPDFHSKERAVVKVDSAMFPAYVGEYEVPSVVKLEVFARDSRLYIQNDPPESAPDELFPESELTFFILNNDYTYTFVLDEKGTVLKMMLNLWPGGPLEAKKVH